MQPTLISGIALAAIGICLLGWFGRDFYFGRASRSWRKADGQIVGRGGRGGGAQRIDDLAAALTYTYSVHGVEYTSNRYDFAGRSADADGGAVVAERAPGQRVTVWYDPAEPRRAVLVQGVQAGNYLRLGIAAALLIAGLAVWDPKVENLGTERVASQRPDPTKPRVLTAAEIDSMQQAPAFVDTFIAKQTHVELRVGDTLWLSSLFAEARDSAGRPLPGVGPTFNIPRNDVLRPSMADFQAVAPGHVSVFIEDRPRDFPIDSIPRRPSTRVDVDVRR
jgi:hypothetical protein